LVTEGFDKEEIEKYKKIKPNLLETCFEKNFINLLIDSIPSRLFQDNKLIHEKWEKKTGY